MKKILLLATGGTIAAKDNGTGLKPGINSDELLQYIPVIGNYCEAEALQILNIDSSNIQPEDWLIICHNIQEAYDLYDGFVITHGTDTMAYTASALSYLIQNPGKPIILTGSQIPMSKGESDAHQNLTDAFWFCVTSGCTGVHIVFDKKVIVGTRASKVKSRSYDAFESINFPVTAYLDDRNYAWPAQCQKLKKIETPKFYNHIASGVFLLKLIPGLEPSILDYVGERYDAIVIESYGMGCVPFADRRNFLKHVERLAANGKILVVATQVKSEGSDLSRYEVGLRAMKSVSLLQSKDMTIESVVTKLMWILTQTKQFNEVEKLFYTPINNDISTKPSI